MQISELPTPGPSDRPVRMQPTDRIPRLALRLLEGEYAICRLPPETRTVPWLPRRGLRSVTATDSECSVVCLASAIPPGVEATRGWRCIRVETVHDTATVGVLASLAEPLARSGISIFGIASYDTDHILVGDGDLPSALSVLRAAGHAI